MNMIHDYMKIWEPFRQVWEVDKDEYLEKYEAENPTALQFDEKINTYTELSNDVQVQDGVSMVHCIRINCVELKKAIVEHCIEWQSKLCQLLHKLTVRNVKEVYSYMKINAEQ